MNNGHAAAVLIVTPQGIPLVRDPEKPDPVFWKFPGGQGQDRETPEECGVREAEEETGIHLPIHDLTLLCSEQRFDHVFTLFMARLSALPEMRVQGNEGEEIGVFSIEAILAMKETFLPGHFAMAEETLLSLLKK